MSLFTQESDSLVKVIRKAQRVINSVTRKRADSSHLGLCGPDAKGFRAIGTVWTDVTDRGRERTPCFWDCMDRNAKGSRALGTVWTGVTDPWD